jgi:superfamily II DNA or RNA helicase
MGPLFLNPSQIFIKMLLRVIEGKNKKFFIVIKEIKTKLDLELFDIIKATLYRKEYKPFVQGFDKNISFSYLFDDVVFPAQFLPDVKRNIAKFTNVPLILENEEILYNVEFSYSDFEFYVNSLKFPDYIDTKSEEYKYQRDSVYFGVKNKIARIDIGTGGGKTFITYLYCKFLFDNFIDENKKILIVVPSKLLAKQLKDDFTDYNKFMVRPLSVETIFTGAKRLLDADVVCGTFQSLSQYDKEYFDDFGVFICDEVHRAKAFSIRNEIFSKITNAEYFFAMSGTMPQYKTLDYLHIVSMFGDSVVVKSMVDLIDDNVATKVQIHMININYDEDKDFCKSLVNGGIVGKEKYAIEKEYFQSNEKRTNIIAKLLNGIPETTLLILDTVNYCNILYQKLSELCPDWDFDIIHGSINGDERDSIIKKAKETRTKYCIIGTYGTMSTGISIPTLTNVYLLDGGKSEFRIGQTIGRVVRLAEDKHIARVIDFHDKMENSSFKSQGNQRLFYYKWKKFPIKFSEITI